jgi:hypothetical protein
MKRILAVVSIAVALTGCAPSLTDNVGVSFLNYDRGGFGAVVIGDFLIHNGNNKTINDIEIVCHGYSKTGSKIDSNKRTIYEYISPYSYKSIDKYNIGFVHPDVSYFKCKAVSAK